MDCSRSQIGWIFMLHVTSAIYLTEIYSYPWNFLPWQYLFIFKIVLTRSWVQFSTILTAYKTTGICFRGHFSHLHDGYHLCRIEAGEASCAPWSDWGGWYTRLRVREWWSSSFGLWQNLLWITGNTSGFSLLFTILLVTMSHKNSSQEGKW